jgi:hypothetical protein
VDGISVFEALAFPMTHRHSAPFRAKVRLSRCRAATDASFSSLAFQSEPTGTVGVPNEQLERAAGGRPQ